MRRDMHGDHIQSLVQVPGEHAGLPLPWTKAGAPAAAAAAEEQPEGVPALFMLTLSWTLQEQL